MIYSYTELSIPVKVITIIIKSLPITAVIISGSHIRYKVVVFEQYILCV